MRVFIAIDINQRIKEALENIKERISSELDIRKGDVKWVRTEAMHLTLKFLGEIKLQQVAAICQAVEQAASGHKSFDMEIRTLGTFPGNCARVLWVGAGKGTKEINALQNDIEGQLTQQGWSPEKRQFAPHLTLCRIKNKKAGIKLAKFAAQCNDFQAGLTRVNSVTVYQSQLKPTGAVYQVLGNYKLQ